MSLLEKDKRKFSVIIGSKKCGACSGASPSGAARKVKGKNGAFYLKETTKGSKKKLYGPYSSKKKVVQRGGKGNEEICKNVLKILKGCDNIHNIHKFDAEMYRINTQYSILEQAYLLLGIKDRMDKCNVLKDIIEVRDKYFILNKKNAEQKKFPLCHCLCNLEIEDNKLVELGFIHSNFEFITSRIKSLTKHNKDNFYEKNWLIFIQFLRNIILQIEVDKLEKNNKELSNLNAEVKKAKANFQARMRESNLGGPAAAEKYDSFNGKPLPNNLLDINNTFAEAGPAKINKSNQRSHNNLVKQLAALKND